MRCKSNDGILDPMTNAQPVTPSCATPNSRLAPPIEQERYSRYLEIRHKALELFARRGFSRVSMRDLATYLGMKAAPFTTTLIARSHYCSN